MNLNLNAAVTRLARAKRISDAIAVLKGLTKKTESAKVQDANDPKPASILNGGIAGLGGAIPPLAVPEAMRGLIERFGTLTPTPELRGLRGRARRDARPFVPDGATFEEHIFASEAGSRSYKLYIPSSYRGKSLPLIVMLHGCTQSPDDFAIGTQMNELAEEEGFLVAYPRQPVSANPSKCWNWFNAGDQSRDRGEPFLIAGLTRKIMGDAAVDSARVYAAGLSAGGAAAAIMGSAYPDIYAAIGVHSGLACGAAKDLPSALNAMRQGGASLKNGASRPLPTIVFHGDSDNTVNPINSDQVIAQSKAGAEFRAKIVQGQSKGGIKYTRSIQSDQSGRSVLEQWTLHGAGHAWSGGNPAGSFTDPRGPDASREMLRFFREHKGTSA